MIVLLGGWLACGFALAGSALPPAVQGSAQGVAVAEASLPHTDGADLGPLAPAAGPLGRLVQLGAALRACAGPCVTPFGTPLGVADGVEARSNCVSTCLRLDYSFVDPESGEIRIARRSPEPERFEYAGLTYQCVEYARRWWIQNRDLTFEDVPTAVDIFALAQGRRLPGREPVPLGRSLNGSAQRAPRRGDLVVYRPDPTAPEWRFGHVAVVVAVDREQGWIALAEENYDNRPWRDPDGYARRIRLFTVAGRHTLVDVPPGELRNPDGGRIAGWVYPLEAH